MRIAVNARYAHRRVTGVERYAGEISLRLFPPLREIKPSMPLAPLVGHLWEQFVLPLLLRSNEVLWSPANTAPWILHRQAVTLHDASVFDHPEWFKPTFGAWTRLSWKVLAKRAKAILTVSNFSSERLQFHLRIPSEKIHVIPNGVGRPFQPKSAQVIEEVRTKYSLTKPYFLFVGTHEPRKNLNTLIRAWELFLKDSKSKFLLAIAGTEGRVFAPVGQNAPSTSSPALHRTQDGVPAQGRPPREGVGPRRGAGSISILPSTLGYVPDSDLPALYSGALAVVVPSHYEGFGLTALEAIACGTPVIASNTPSFAEVVGDAAILVSSNNPAAIANAMCQIMEDQTLTVRLRERGLKRARQFNWDDSAHKIQALVESL